jgi:hypothetical protein
VEICPGGKFLLSETGCLPRFFQFFPKHAGELLSFSS